MANYYLTTYLQPTHDTSNNVARPYSTKVFLGRDDESSDETKARFGKEGSIIHEGEVIHRKILTWGLQIEAVCPSARAFV